MLLTNGIINPIAVKYPKFAHPSRLSDFELDCSLGSIKSCKTGKRDESDKYKNIPASAAKKYS